MNERATFSAGAEARRAAAADRPGATPHHDALLRYLGAVTAASAQQAAQRTPVRAAEPKPAGEPGAQQPQQPPAPGPLEVRDVMDVPAPSVPGQLRFPDIARVLNREQTGLVAVVDEEDRVMGVVSASDLLAKAAIAASGRRPALISRSRERRLHEKARGQTAETLMTSPAITVYPGTPVAEAAWLAALSRLKRMPVTDHEGRLVGVVHRDALLQALLRSDDQIRWEIESQILAADFPAARGDVTVAVRDGVVELGGRMAEADAKQLIVRIEDIDDVIDVRNRLAPA
ncbi:CBS domain-containing protein [Streptomyces sp. HNM0663]|uniref:CBS domain-containing protein n=1 Tax=Streptomyces chengmaiensis TaxID=3040919 RepID=A0ABT6HKM2_9ACTN|nr:CBS domain-containing protein [Streptomyces chengmaiensis]MDH2388847.1 CBS domain-containing protein [Streptomyces chengmaiensis]